MDDIQLSELYFALSAKFNECIAEAASVKKRMPPTRKSGPHDHDSPQNVLSCIRGWEEQNSHYGGARGSRESGLLCCSRVEISYLPAAHTQKEAQHIGLLLLLELFDVFEGTHLRGG